MEGPCCHNQTLYSVDNETLDQVLVANIVKCISCGDDLDFQGVITTISTTPVEMQRTWDNLISSIVYCILFFFAACGNLTVFITLFRNRHRKSRVNLFIMHLSIADLIVTFVMMPTETAWHMTVAWKAGDIACRFLMFWRLFGFYLSSFILIAISLDRYFAIMRPLSLSDADRRGKLMLMLAWFFSIIASSPQVSKIGLILLWNTSKDFMVNYDLLLSNSTTTTATKPWFFL